MPDSIYDFLRALQRCDGVFRKRLSELEKRQRLLGQLGFLLASRISMMEHEAARLEHERLRQAMLAIHEKYPMMNHGSLARRSSRRNSPVDMHELCEEFPCLSYPERARMMTWLFENFCFKTGFRIADCTCPDHPF